MKSDLEIFHKKILLWNEGYKKLPKTNLITSLVILLIGVLGLIVLIIFKPETPYFLSIFAVSAFIGAIWFSIMTAKILKLSKIRKELNLLTDFNKFELVMDSMISLRKNSHNTDSAEQLKQTLAKEEITSRYLIIELNRMALEMLKNSRN